MKETIPPRIRLVNVTKKFGFGDAEIRALDNVDLTVKKGEFIAITIWTMSLSTISAHDDAPKFVPNTSASFSRISISFLA